MMNLRERLWCFFHFVCYKHGVEKVCGINALYCQMCRKESSERYRQRLERIQKSRRNINSIAR